MTEEVVKKSLIPEGWRKWLMCMGIILIATGLIFCKQPGTPMVVGGTLVETWVPVLTGAQWIWVAIRIAILYLLGNVAVSMSAGFFAK
ncbi:MAG TPA: hypothetical protein VMW95_02305 [Desulfobacterales bacterium]|nr:hypothetical protein [Desulfobacterales bacterium]